MSADDSAKVRLCSKCQTKPKYKSHGSYCYDCIRSYNANRYRKGSALKDFFPEMRKRVLEISTMIGSGTATDEDLLGKVTSLSDFLVTVETQLPGTVKEREDRWVSRKTEVEARMQNATSEEEQLYEIMMNHWDMLVNKDPKEAGKYALEILEPMFPDAFDRGWRPKEH